MPRKKLFFFEFSCDGRANVPIVVSGYTKKQAMEQMIDIAIDKASGNYYDALNPHYYVYHGYLDICTIPSGQAIVVGTINKEKTRSSLMKGRPEHGYLPIIIE